MGIPQPENDASDDCTETCDVASGCQLGPEALCLHMTLVHAEKADLCDQLEAIADSLPNHVDRLACLRIAGRLVPLLRQAHRFEEELLFPVFEVQKPAAAHAGTIKRLKSEHLYDECSAEEITEELLHIGHGDPVRNPEALGFMLRAFFDTVRRHMAFEREHIFPATRQFRPRSIPGDV